MNDFELQHLPEAYRPLSPWTYFGLGILYSLPLVGWMLSGRGDVARGTFA